MNGQLSSRLSPIPESLAGILTPKQSLTVAVAKDHGWELYFIRQDSQGFADAGIRHAHDKINGIIDKDGNFTANSVSRNHMNAQLSEIFRSMNRDQAAVL